MLILVVLPLFSFAYIGQMFKIINYRVPSYVVIEKERLFFQDTILRCIFSNRGRWIEFEKIDEIEFLENYIQENVIFSIRGEKSYHLVMNRRGMNILKDTVEKNHIPIISRKYWDPPPINWLKP